MYVSLVLYKINEHDMKLKAEDVVLEVDKDVMWSEWVAVIIKQMVVGHEKKDTGCYVNEL